MDPALPAIVPDDYGGSPRLVDHLLDQGHSRIAHVRLNPTLKAAHLRLAAYRDAMATRNVAVDETLVVDGIDGEVGKERNVAFESTLALLRRKQPPTAIFCGNYEIALQVFCAILSQGLQIPRNISVVGFDDFQQCLGERPQLTPAALRYFQMAMRARPCSKPASRRNRGGCVDHGLLAGSKRVDRHFATLDRPDNRCRTSSPVKPADLALEYGLLHIQCEKLP